MNRFTLNSCWYLSVAVGLLMPSHLVADQSEDEAAIRKSAEAYAQAFNQRNAKAIAAMWAEQAVYENPLTGDSVVGRSEIEKQLAGLFQEMPNAKLEVEVNSVQFMSPHVAVEEGVARVLIPDMAPDETSYSAVHIKSGNKWLIDRMTEQPRINPKSNYSKLRDLEWMIGTWVDQDDQATIETTCQWTKNQNFIMRAFKVSVQGDIDLSGMQFIGWDPANEKIRSWVFDSDGGFAEATWTKRDKKWIVSVAATLPDGRKSSAVNIFTQVDDSTMTWESTGRELDGEILPNIKPVNIKRKTESE